MSRPKAVELLSNNLRFTINQEDSMNSNNNKESKLKTYKILTNKKWIPLMSSGIKKKKS